MLDTVIPNLVDVASKGFGFFLAVAVFRNQLVHVVQLLLIVLGNSEVFLSVSRMIRMVCFLP